jgi:NADPH2:quinone reductase
MRAVLCRAYGPPSSLTVEEVPEPEPGAGEVVVGVKACGVNFPDTLMIQGKYQFKPEFPFSPGGEVAGTVLRVGPGLQGVRPGDRVIAYTGHGGFAEQVAVGSDRLVHMPPGMDFVPASAFVMTYGTALHALQDRGRLAPGETLLVLGAAGGVGLAAIDIGKALGARIIAAASSGDKLALCREHGADETIDYASENLRERLRALTDDRGVDVVFDPVGGPYAEPALRGIAWGGRFLVVGFAAGEIPEVRVNRLLLRNTSLVGVFWGGYVMGKPELNREIGARIEELVDSGAVRPVVGARFPLERGADALRLLDERGATGKVVLDVG